MLASTVVTHNGSTALHTCPLPQSAASSTTTPHQPHLYQCVAVADSSCATALAVARINCGMHDHRTRVALVRSTECQRPPPRTTRTQHHEAMATHVYVHSSGAHKTSNETRAISSSVAQPRVNPRDTRGALPVTQSRQKYTIVTHSTASESSSPQSLYARATRTVCFVSMLTVCLQCTITT